MLRLAAKSDPPGHSWQQRAVLVLVMMQYVMLSAPILPVNMQRAHTVQMQRQYR